MAEGGKQAAAAAAAAAPAAARWLFRRILVGGGVELGDLHDFFQNVQSIASGPSAPRRLISPLLDRQITNDTSFFTNFRKCNKNLKRKKKKESDCCNIEKNIFSHGDDYRFFSGDNSSSNPCIARLSPGAAPPRTRGKMFKRVAINRRRSR